MADTIRDIVVRYLSGEATYPEAMSELSDLVGQKQAHDMLRCAVEQDNDTYLQLAVAAA